MYCNKKFEMPIFFKKPHFRNIHDQNSGYVIS